MQILKKPGRQEPIEIDIQPLRIFSIAPTETVDHGKTERQLQNIAAGALNVASLAIPVLADIPDAIDIVLIGRAAMGIVMNYQAIKKNSY